MKALSPPEIATSRSAGLAMTNEIVMHIYSPIPVLREDDIILGGIRILLALAEAHGNKGEIFISGTPFFFLQ